MITLEAAQKAAEKAIKGSGYVIIGYSDMADAFVFATNYKGADELVPDSPDIQVRKSNGEVTMYDTYGGTKDDPYKNLDALLKAKYHEF